MANVLVASRLASDLVRVIVHAPACGKRFSRLAQAVRTQTIFAGFDHRQPVRLGRAPAASVIRAVEWRAATRASEAAGCHRYRFAHGSPLFCGDCHMTYPNQAYDVIMLMAPLI